jgi:anti-sigma factor RsiW
MNCEKCQELLSDFLDGAIGDADRSTFDAHLQECLPCFNVHAEMNSIVTFCRETRGEDLAPPNPQALWLRILNTVEIEQATAARAAATNPKGASQRENWWSRMMGRSWELSLPQVAMAVVAIIVVASLATVFSLRGLEKGVANLGEAVAATSNGGARGGAPAAALMNTNYDWQQQQIKYWNQVVEQRKVNWNPQVRADFERNLSLLDETVRESLDKLSQQPHDDLTEEMLNSALDDKMQLLKEFSDL